MKKILVASMLMLIATTAYASNLGPYVWPVVRVVDGDTFQVDPDWLPHGLKLSIRVKGVDTPEKAPRAQCEKEADLGKKATEYTTTRMANAIAGKEKVTLKNIEWDKFGGRMLADVYIGESTETLTQELISHGLAREYFGDKKKSWCE
jgi:endonuclease YncB( thermonuclease family)